jgi:prepilin-type N-terminal cleavage/methylation domain-containing protein
MNQPRLGYTLIELVLAITLLAISISATAFWIVQGNHQRVQTHDLRQALELADLYLAEVISSGKWDELTNQTPSSSGRIPTNLASIGAEEAQRSQYDDCDDYHGFQSVGNHTNKNGTSWGMQYQRFTVSVSVYFVAFGTLSASNTVTDIKRIDVNVTWGNNQKAVLSTLQTNA